MTGNRNNPNEKESFTLLIADHKRFSHMVCRVEDRCDLLIDRLLKLLTATMAALVALVSVTPETPILSGQALLLITGTLLGALCIFGFVTFAEVIRGQLAAIRWRIRLDMIRKVFQNILMFDEYTPFNPAKIRGYAEREFGNRLVGGSSTVILALNIGTGTAAVGILALITFPLSILYTIVASLVSGIVIGITQYLLQEEIIRRSYARVERKDI